MKWFNNSKTKRKVPWKENEVLKIDALNGADNTFFIIKSVCWHVPRMDWND